jgi:hypothetical protein
MVVAARQGSNIPVFPVSEHNFAFVLNHRIAAYLRRNDESLARQVRLGATLTSKSSRKSDWPSSGSFGQRN